MPITLWPTDAIAGAPAYNGRRLRQALGVLLGGATSSRPLGGRSGVRPGTSGLVSATSTTWTVNPHAGSLDLESGASVGPYLYSVDDTSNTGSMTAADATNSRIDIVYVTVNDPAESDGSSVPGAVFGYLAGVAGSGLPPATPARSMLLSTISVPKSGSGSPTTSDAAPFTAAAGAPIQVHTQAERDALFLYDGLTVYRLDLHCFETYNGTAWVGYMPWISVAQTVASATPTAATWTAQAFNSVTETKGFTYSGGVFTVPVAGVYLILVQFTYTSSSPVVQIGAGLCSTSAPSAPLRRNFGSSMTGANATISLECEWRFNAGDQFTLSSITAASGHNLEVAANGAGTFATVRWVRQ